MKIKLLGLVLATASILGFTGCENHEPSWHCRNVGPTNVTAHNWAKFSTPYTWCRGRSDVISGREWCWWIRDSDHYWEHWSSGPAGTIDCPV